MSPISQPSSPDFYQQVTEEQWDAVFEDMQQENRTLHREVSQLSETNSAWRQTTSENQELRRKLEQFPAAVRAFKEMKRENQALFEEMLQLKTVMSEMYYSSKPVTRQAPPPCSSVPQRVSGEREESYRSRVAPSRSGSHPTGYAREVRQPSPDMMVEVASRLRRLELSYSAHPPAHHAPPPSSACHTEPPTPPNERRGYYSTRHSCYSPEHRQAVYVHCQGHATAPPTPPSERREYYGPTRRSYHSSEHHRAADVPYDHLPVPRRENTYKGPRPTIPDLVHPDAREFSRLRIALENVLPDNASERFRFQVLTDHLKLEEAQLVADSYCNSRYPFTDTMDALTKMYGQPHRLALQHIAELMDGADVASGDVKSFHMFALRVRSLVSMLEQLGRKGRVELECGSHVTRLLGKLPHDLRSNFKRFIHPLRIPIPTLIDLSEWLEYEIQIQEDGVHSSGHQRREFAPKKRDQHKDKRPAKTTILLSTEKPADVETKSSEKQIHITPAKNGGRSLEAYAVLDDGSERTILLHAAAQELGLRGQPEDLALRTVRQDVQILHGAAVSFMVSPASQPKKVFCISGAFTAEPLGLAEHTHPAKALQQRYHHLAGLPLQQFEKVHPVLLIGSDCPHLITPIAPVRFGPPGGPAAVNSPWLDIAGPSPWTQVRSVTSSMPLHICRFALGRPV
ncbi:hypothetical protein SKAU_G00091650 [Synaphobranchus kaupii]|uniref:Uncharacterized protein n=1 Tax=Synaphobranchus kaupii TaxID=118154 RepID=A0A9Q1J5G7_SYNKA|nr:hypothetical protein SKAU_G00091650 [Synaphobranchus kaupii]